MRPSSGTSKILTLLLSTTLFLVSGNATAGPEEAREYFKQAKTAYENKEYERAAELLKKAYAEEANLTYQYNRVRALQGAEKYAEALEVLETYEKPMLDAKGFEDVPRLKRALKKEVGETEDPSSESSTNSSVSGPADTMTEPDPPSGSTNPGSQPRSDAPTLTYVGWGLAGTGVVLLGTGTLYATTALLPQETKQRVQNDTPLTDEDRTVIQRQKTLSIVFLSVGAGALVGGGVILYRELSGSDEPESTSANRQFRLMPWANRRGGGARLQIRF